MDKPNSNPSKAETPATPVARSKKLFLIAPVIIILVVVALGLQHVHWSNKHVQPGSSKSDNLVELDLKDIKKEASGEDKAYAYIRLANDYSSNKDYKNVLKSYLAADKTWPNQPLIIGNIASAYFDLRDKDNSIKFFSQAIALVKADPNSNLKSSVANWQATIAQVQNGDFSIKNDFVAQ